MGANENKSGRPKKGANPFTDIFRELIGSATQQEAAEKIGVSRQNVGRWLSGDTTPDIEALCKIANAYNVSTDYLLGRTRTKSPKTEIRAVCDFMGLSQIAINNITFITKLLRNAKCTGFDIERVGVWEVVDPFFESDFAFFLFKDIQNYVNKYIENNSLILEMKSQLKEDSDNGELDDQIEELEQEIEFAKWRTSEYFKECIDYICETVYNLKGTDKNG